MKIYKRPVSLSKKSLVWISVILLAALFIYAAYNKLIIYDTFVQQLRLSPATKGYENFLAWFIPGLEITIAILVLFSKTRIIGFYGAFFLMLAFTIYVYVLPHFFKDHACSCGGIINNFSWKEHFYFNLLFTLIAAAGLVMSSILRQQKTEQT